MKPSPSNQKLRGGYYTPKPIADFLCTWAIKHQDATVLEPSCGDGVFLASAVERLISLGHGPGHVSDQVVAVEVEPEEARKAEERLKALGLARPHLLVGDFFAFANGALGDFLAFCKGALADRRFDSVVGNPPFIRYQSFSEPHRLNAFDIMTRAELRPNRLTNAWVPFVVASTLLLKEGGRLAMVIPAELLQVSYAADLRRFLSTNYTRLTIFAFRRLVFGDIQQEVILLCGERGRSNAEDAWIRTVELTDLSEVLLHNHTEFEQAELKTMDHSSEKWTQYFLSKGELDLIRRVRTHPKLARLGDVASVDVGIVTGLNDFFVLTNTRAARLGLRRYTVPLVTRSAQLKGAVFDTKDWENNRDLDAPALLLRLPRKRAADLADAAMRYVKWGEKQGFHTGFKCRIRKPWHFVPSVWSPDAFLLRQIHGYPKLVLNAANTTCTDTIHRVRFKDPSEGPRIVTAFLNSLTFAFAEVIGRSYGGGVLELEPNEADGLPLPLAGAEALELKAADGWLRDGQEIGGLLERHDRVLLGESLGLSREEVLTLRRIWAKLRDRRIERKSPNGHGRAKPGRANPKA